jgi:hypothetical protein
MELYLGGGGEYSRNMFFATLFATALSLNPAFGVVR